MLDLILLKLPRHSKKSPWLIFPQCSFRWAYFRGGVIYGGAGGGGGKVRVGFFGFLFGRDTVSAIRLVHSSCKILVVA